MNSAVGQYGDTTYTKVFVGGLAWETQKDTMKKYFEQFGEILEAVVITDKATGRSKGYGFVTFREPEGAMRACIDPTPVIDGRRANCNLAYLGLQRSKPSTPKQGVGRNWRVMSTAGYGGGRGAAFPTATAAFPHYAVQQGIPFSSLYGYSVYSPDYGYPTGYYGMYGGGGAVQYPMYGAGGGGRTGGAAFYPYSQYGEASGGTTYPTATGQSYQYQAHPLFHYSSSTYPSPHYASPVSLSLSAPPPSVCFAVPQA